MFDRSITSIVLVCCLSATSCPSPAKADLYAVYKGCRYNSDDLSASQLDCERAIKDLSLSDKDRASAHAALANIYSHKRRFELAKAHYRESVKINFKSQIPVSLTCPLSENGQTLEWIQRSKAGEAARFRVSYKSDTVTFVETAWSDSGEPFHIFLTYDIATETRPGAKENGADFASRADKLRNEVCGGSADTKRDYFEMLEANKEALLQ